MTEKIIVNVDRDLEDLMPLFMETRQRDLEGLSKGLAINDFASLHRIGHGMKGSGGAFGFQWITETGAIIEASALVNDHATIQKQFAPFSDYLARVEIQCVGI